MKDILNKYKKIIKAFIAFCIFLSSRTIQLFLIRILNINLKKITYKEAIPLSCISSLIILFLLIFLYKNDLKKEWKIYKNKLNENIDIAFKYWIIGFGLMVFSNIIINYFLHAGQANNEQIVQKMIDTYPLLLLISAGFIAPINEEIIFRKTFKDNIKNKLLYILISGIIFGYVHVINATTIPQFLYIIPYSSLGIMFAKAYDESNTVFTSISMHMFHNTAITILSILV